MESLLLIVLLALLLSYSFLFLYFKYDNNDHTIITFILFCSIFPMEYCFPCCCMVCVREMNAGVIENCGKYSRIAPPGCHCIAFPFQTVTSRVSLKIRNLEVLCDTKSKDNVFVSVIVAVQYKVVDTKVPSAYYKLTDPASQIRSYVFDVIRSSLPRLDLDDAFASKR